MHKDSNKPRASAILTKIDRLMAGKKGCADVSVPGFIRMATGAWVHPDSLQQVLTLFDEAVSCDEPPYFALYSRADFKLSVGLAEAAEQDLKLLSKLGSTQGTGMLPLKLALMRGSRTEADRLLTVVNEPNKLKGLPKYKLSDFKLHLIGPALTKLQLAELAAAVKVWNITVSDS